ncbi:MAG: fructosamine kinase family protein [Polyangiales bacterium]
MPKSALPVTPLHAALTRALGPIRALASVSGGDINEAFAVTLSDGSRVFVKTRADAPPDTFAVEARSLDFLREASVLRIPRVLAACEDPPFLALEWIRSAPRSPRFDTLLGEGLAALHAHGAPAFGHHEDTYLGPYLLPNAARPDWATFYAEQRLAPALERASPRLGGVRDKVEQVIASTSGLVSVAEPPARLHGDLWSGNVMSDEHGAPVLIDPAVYGGHREMDLAMLALFGSPSARFFGAYDAVYPRSPGHEARVALHQLLPLLVHVSLFGGGYVRAVEEAADRALGR